MSGRPTRGTLRTGLVQAGVAMLTGWVTLLSWRGFSTNATSYLGPLLLAGALIAGVGALLRWSRIAGALVIAVQVLVLAAFLNLVIVGSPIPWGGRWDQLIEAFRAATEATRVYASPVPAEAATITPLMLPLGLILLLLIDVFAGTLRRVPLAGLSLLTMYSIPVSLLLGGVSWWVFVLSAAGFLTMLFLHEDEQIARWGRPMGASEAEADPTGFGVRTGAVRTTAVGIGSAATAVALLLPALIPTLHLGIFGGGNGPGNGDVHIENPMTDLRRDLQQGRDVPLLRITTDDPAPAYLRISALTRFSNNEWSSGDREIPNDQAPDGTMPPPEGVSATVQREEYAYQVSAYHSFDSIWLPTMAPATSVRATGNWRYDRSTMDFLAIDDGTDTAGLDYSMTADKLDLDPAAIAAAPSASSKLQERFTALPEGLPFEVKQIADQVTAGQPTKFQKATALQEWFRKSGGFTYDLHTAPGNGTDALLDFLQNKVGYCEQFASAMAVMARLEGIPTRVAVGFLRPDQIGPNTWEYSSHDLHAWVEAFFPGSGWVLFDPTPGSRTGAAPSYTTAGLPGPTTDPSASVPTQQASDDLPSRGSSASAKPEQDPTAGAKAGKGGQVPWLPILAVLAALLVLALVVVTPRTLRRWRNDRRWATWPGPEAAWAELEDTLVDLGRPWARGLSPRAAAVRLVGFFGRPPDHDTADRPRHGAGVAPEAEVALERIVESLELLRYAAPGRPRTEALQAEVDTCVSALYGGATATARRRATWLPRSVLRLPTRVPAAGSVEVVGQGGLVDHVG